MKKYVSVECTDFDASFPTSYCQNGFVISKGPLVYMYKRGDGCLIDNWCTVAGIRKPIIGNIQYLEKELMTRFEKKSISKMGILELITN